MYLSLDKDYDMLITIWEGNGDNLIIFDDWSKMLEEWDKKSQICMHGNIKCLEIQQKTSKEQNMLFLQWTFVDSMAGSKTCPILYIYFKLREGLDWE